MTSKRICVVGNGATTITSPTGGWINRHTGHFLKDLQKNGLNVTYCEVSQECKTLGFLQDFNLDSNDVKFWGVPARPYLMRLKKMFKLLWRLRKIDFVYLFFPGTFGRHVAQLCRVLGVPYGLYVRGEQFGDSKGDLKIIACAKFALTVSPTLEQKLLKSCSNVALIRPMTDITEQDFRQRDSSRDSPIAWNLFYVGRLEERKGTFDLFQIALHLRKRGVPFVLRLAGNGPAESQIHELVAEHQIEDQVQLLGFLDSASELSNRLEEADAFVFPSHDEGFPRVLLEAMSKSLPVFTTMVGGIPGLMVDNVNCYEIPVRSAEAASEIIQTHLKHADSLQRVAEQGYSTAREVLLGRSLHHEVFAEHLLGGSCLE